MKFKLALFALFICQVCNAQQQCDTLLTFEQSQVWIKATNLLPDEERKTRIFERILCEQKDSTEFSLDPIVNGIWIATNNFRTDIFKLVDAKHIYLLPSLCGGNIYPQRCNLGFVVFDLENKPIFNHIEGVHIKKIKRLNKRQRISLSIQSDKKIAIHINTKNFGNKEKDRQQCLLLKKGTTNFSFATKNELMLIEISTNAKKILIVG